MFVLISLCVKLKKNKITDEACVAEGAGWWWWWRPGRIAVGGGQDARKWVSQGGVDWEKKPKIASFQDILQ